MNKSNSMKQVFVISIAAVCYGGAIAQNCTDKDLTTMPGSWKQSPDVKGRNMPAPELIPKEKLICDKILELIRSNFKYTPAGGDIFYDNVYNLDAYNSTESVSLKRRGYAYKTGFRFLQYACNNGRLEHIPGSLLLLQIEMNDIPVHFSKSFFVSRLDKNGNAMEKDPENDLYGFLPELPDREKPYWDYTDDKVEGNGNYENHIVDQYRMLHKPGKLPFIPMTKKEYYDQWKKYYLQQMKYKEAVIDAHVAEYKKIDGGDKMIEREKKLVRIDDMFVNKIDAILNSKAAEALARPAIAGEEQSQYFEQVVPGTDHTAYIIKPNPLYHNATLPPNAPQVITIHLNYFKRKGNKEAEWKYHAEGVYKELERSNIRELLTEKLLPVIVQ
jgi:hypothetical protein